MQTATSQGDMALRRPRRRGPLLVLLLALLPSAALADDYDRWYTVDMAGGRAGYCHAVQKTDGDKITTTNEIKFKISRAQVEVKLELDGEFVETKAGKPVSMKTVMKFAQIPVTLVCTYGEKDMKVDLTRAGSVTHQTLPLPEGVWLTPAAASDYVKQRLAAKADKIEVRTVDPGGLDPMDPMGVLKPALITHSDCRPESIQALGKALAVTRCITTTSAQAGVQSVEFLDDQGVPVRSDTNFGGLAMSMSAATREEAKANRAGPEMMTNTFVKPDRPIPNAREITKAVYEVSMTDGKLPVFPDTGSQRFAPINDSSGRLTIDTKALAPAPEADRADPAFTQPSAMVNSDDEKVKQLTEEALKKAAQSPAAKAETLRRFVFNYITDKDLDVGFASAAETARTRKGDCTEHGVLLAAMLRAGGIPSRIACGLVYVDGFAGAEGVFGYHMWAQALLDRDGKPTWVDLDGTLDVDSAFDAAHIALAVSALSDGKSQDTLITLATIIGRLRIKVDPVQDPGKP